MAPAFDPGLRAVVIDPAAFEVKCGEWQRSAVRVPESAVDAEQDHCSQRRRRRDQYRTAFTDNEHPLDQRSHLVRLEYPRPLLRPFQSQDPLGWPREPRAETNRLFEQFVFEAVL